MLRSKHAPFPSPILTAKQADALESFAALQRYGVTEEDYHAVREQRIATYGGEPSIGDVIWALWQEVTKQTIDHPERGADIYRDMAATLQREGKDASHMLRQSARAGLLNVKGMGVTHVEAITANDARTCEACKEAAARGSVPIDEEMENPRVPNPACTSEFCRCGHTYSMDREARPPAPEPEHDPSPSDAEKSGCAAMGLAGVVGLIVILVST